MKIRLLLILLILFTLPSKGQRLVSVLSEKSMDPAAQFDSVKCEFGPVFDLDSYKLIVDAACKMCRRVRFVALEYRTQDPLGRDVVASGLLAYPEKGRIKGVIEISPVSKEKQTCGSAKTFTGECLPSMMGYLVLVPDTIGYGSTQDLPLSFLMCQNVALVSAHFREAAGEYLRSLPEPQKMPDETILFGYSLGASGVLETAAYYSNHPEYHVKVKTLYLGGGAYDPALTANSTLAAGESTYLIYPTIVQSLKYWLQLDLHYDKLFRGRVLEDMDRFTCGKYNIIDLTEEYGTDIYAYLNPDFFTPRQNDDIRQMMEGLESLRVPSSPLQLKHGTKIYLRASEEDKHVPIASTDWLYRQLKDRGFWNVTYFRDKKGDHYDGAIKAFLDLFIMVF